MREIDKKPGLLQLIGPDGEPKRFQAKARIVDYKVITTDSKGEETTMRRLDISEELTS